MIEKKEFPNKDKWVNKSKQEVFEETKKYVNEIS